MEKDYIITKAGLEKLKKEIDKTQEELKEVLFQKGDAYETGGDTWHDNFSFEQLTQQAMMLNKRLAELKERLKNAKIINDEEDKSTAKVRLGSRMVVELDGKKQEFIITDPEVADPRNGSISYQSPLGKALLGAKRNEERSFMIGNKVIKVRVIEL